MMPHEDASLGATPAADPSNSGYAAAGSLAGPWRRIAWTDLAAAVALGALGAAAAIIAQHILAPWLRSMSEDVFFQADPLRVLEQMNTRWHSGGYTRNHPLFVILVQPPVYVFRVLTGASRLDSALAAMTVGAAVWCAAMYATLRLAGVRLVDAALLVIAALTTSSFLFWFSLPETFPFSAITLLAPFMAAAVVERVKARERLLIAAGVVSFVLNIANWMAGIAAAFSALPWRRALQVSLNVIAIATIAWGVQRRVYPALEFFLDKPPDPESVYAPSLPRAARSVRSVFVHSAVLPEVQLCDNPPVSWAPDAPKHYLSVQEVNMTGATGWIAAVSWLALLGLGLAELRRVTRVFKYTLVATIIGQIALHTAFGGETFLYAMHFLTVLLLLAGLAMLGRRRRLAQALLVVFAASAATANVHQLRRTAGYFAAPPGDLTSVGHTCMY